jgi:hypothetical protein
VEDKNALGLKKNEKSDVRDIVVRIETKVVKPRKGKRETGRGKRIMEVKEK